MLTFRKIAIDAANFTRKYDLPGLVFSISPNLICDYFLARPFVEDRNANAEKILFGLPSFVTFRLAKVHFRLNAQAAAILAEKSKLKLAEWRVMATIEMNNKTTAADIARYTETDKGQISRSLKSLKGRGFIAVKGDERDHRTQNLNLTKAGRVEYEKLVGIMRKHQTQLTEGIDADDLSIFLSVLQHLEDRADEPLT